MYEASELFKKAIRSRNRELRCRATIGNIRLTDTYIKSFYIEDSILTNDEFKLGTATASILDLTINNVMGKYNVSDFTDKIINIEIGVVLKKFNKNVEYLNIGSFLVEKAVKDDKLIRLTAYDKMILFDKDYISTLTYPATLLQIANEICNNVGVSLESTSFINSNYVVQTNPTLTKEKKVTCRDAIAMLSELSAGYAIINRKGNLEIVTLKDSGQEINQDNYFYLKKDENVTTIDKLIINSVSKGKGNNAIGILNNIFVGDPNLLIDNIYNKINNFEFMPFTCKWSGDLLLRAGDLIKINDGENTYPSFIAKQKIVFEDGLRVEITTNSKAKLAKDFAYKGTLEKEKEENQGKIDNLKDKTEDLEKSDADIKLNIKNTKEGLENSINITARGLEGQIKDTKEGLENKISVTAEGIRGELKNTKEGLESKVDFTAKQLKIQFQEADSNLSSYISQTARNIQMQVQDVEKNTGSRIDVLDREISSKVSEGEVYSIIKQSPNAVQYAFNDISASVTIDRHGLTVSNGTIRSVDIIGSEFSGGNIQTENLTARGEVYFRQGVNVGDDIYAHGTIGARRNLQCEGDLNVTGTKNCIQTTKNFGKRLINAYETAEIFYGDLGFGIIKEGVCIIKIDQVMRECFNTDVPYHVFTQVYNGRITQINRYPSYFVVKGEESTEFSWEIKAKRLGYENIRLTELTKKEGGN